MSSRNRGRQEIVVNPITDTGDLTHTAGPGLTDAADRPAQGRGRRAALKADLRSSSGEYSLGEAENDGGGRASPSAGSRSRSSGATARC